MIQFGPTTAKPETAGLEIALGRVLKSMPESDRIRSDMRVYLLVGAFCLAALLVFGLAMSRHRMRRQESVSDRTRQAASGGSDIPKAGMFRVVRVVDGDTMVVIGTDALELSIRLRGIDAPELGQPGGLEAKQALERKTDEHELALRDVRKGKYGRFDASVFADSMCVNREMIKDGLAWCDEVYSFSEEYCALQQQAQRERAGIWKESNPQPPWVYREQRR